MRVADVFHTLRLSAVASIAERAATAGWSDAIQMAGGEPQFPVAPEVLEALRLSPVAKVTKYSPLKGYPLLLEKLCEKLAAVNGIDANPERVICTPGASEALFATLFVALNPGDEVLVQNPCWEHYPQVVAIAGGRARPFSMRVTSGRYEPDLDELKAAITDRTKVLLLNTPLNPCGAVLTRTEIEAILEIARAHNLLVICDEEYEAFLYGGRRHVSPAAVDPTVVTIHSFSKTFSLTGIRLAYVTGAPDFVDALKRFALYTYMFPSSPAQCIAEAALSLDYGRHVASVRADFEGRMRRIVELLVDIPGVQCPAVEGGVYIFPRITAAGDCPAALGLVEEEHLLCVPGEAFGSNGSGHVRMFFGLAESHLAAAASRIRAFTARQTVGLL